MPPAKQAPGSGHPRAQAEAEAEADAGRASRFSAPRACPLGQSSADSTFARNSNPAAAAPTSGATMNSQS